MLRSSDGQARIDDAGGLRNDNHLLIHLSSNASRRIRPSTYRNVVDRAMRLLKCNRRVTTTLILHFRKTSARTLVKTLGDNICDVGYFVSLVILCYQLILALIDFVSLVSVFSRETYLSRLAAFVYARANFL